MVAYSFNRAFVPQVEALTKVQTVRLPRKRHARPDEPLQLYTGMRTKNCRKLVDPDPTCVAVDEVIIDRRSGCFELVVNGIPLNGEQIEDFAKADGFDPVHHFAAARAAALNATSLMRRWWTLTHGAVLFEGVVIRWEPAVG